MKRLLLAALVAATPWLVCLPPTAGAQLQAGQAGEPAPPPAPKIPGINAEDQFPHGCVDCHVNRPDMKLDVRLSTTMRRWNQEVEPSLIANVQAIAAPGVVLKGSHPVVSSALRDIPAGCLTCHGETSKIGLPFAPMIHRLHLTGGDQNHFMTLFQGECTHCHKLDMATGRWSLPSGPEKE